MSGPWGQAAMAQGVTLLHVAGEPNIRAHLDMTVASTIENSCVLWG